MRNVKSHGGMEVEIWGQVDNVDDVCMHLAAEFGAASTYYHRMRAMLEDAQDNMKRQLDLVQLDTKTEVDILRLAMKQVLDELREVKVLLAQLQQKQPQQPEEPKHDPTYFG